MTLSPREIEALVFVIRWALLETGPDTLEDEDRKLLELCNRLERME
jgi:hypothetical protein